MKRTILTIPVLVCALSGEVPATPGRFPVDRETIEGTWEALDFQHGAVFRLQVNRRRAKVIVTSGPKQGEFIFEADAVAPKSGRLAFRGVDATLGLTLRVKGRGWASSQIGTLRLWLDVVEPTAAPWDETEFVFLKATPRSRIQALVTIENRAKALLSGSERRAQEGGQ